MLSDFSDLADTITRQMLAPLHHQENTTELLEVLSLPRLERVRHEERDDPLSKVLEFPNSIRHSVAVVPSNHPTPEEILQAMEDLHVSFVLDDGEFRKHLNARCHLGMLSNSDMKAAFTVHETGNPRGFQLHGSTPNIKSLRIPIIRRAFPADCPRVRWLFTEGANANEYQTAVMRRFPHMVQFY